MKVIAYLHTHWDREWYREFEVFRLRLLRVFDNVLALLKDDKIPSFYFDGQVSALLDYLELRPEREEEIRKYIKEKRLFIGPFYTLVDEFLTDRETFKKNLEIGLKISKEFGCSDFVGYLADTFGHSKNIPEILKEYEIDKCAVWRGCPKNTPSEFEFCAIDTVNLVRGYFMDIFSFNISIEEKAKLLKDNLDKIAEKSGEYILLPIGADHLGVEFDISEQIEKINEIFKTQGTKYEIKLSNIFEYFELVKDNFKNCIWNDELRDNSNTFILQGAYSSRLKLKRYNIECEYILHEADRLQKYYGNEYTSAIEYAYKLLLKNQAHDGICGCSTDLVHRENITRFEKVKQVANTVIEELRLKHGFKTPFMKSKELIPEYKVTDKVYSVDNRILYDTQKIPITEDFSEMYMLKKSPAITGKLKLELKNGKILITNGEQNVWVEFVRYKDEGDTYNFGAVEDDSGETAEIYSFKNDIIKTSFFDVEVDFGELINFKIVWDNKYKNKLWQVKFNLKSPVEKTFSEDMNTVIERRFDCEYDMRKHLPKTRGIEVRTNFAPMQRYVGAQGFGIITKGLTEYEVKEKSLSVTLLRSVGVISNPENPSRSTPAGPPIEVFDAQQLGENIAEFSVGFFEPENYQKYIDVVYPKFL